MFFLNYNRFHRSTRPNVTGELLSPEILLHGHKDMKIWGYQVRIVGWMKQCCLPTHEMWLLVWSLCCNESLCYYAAKVHNFKCYQSLILSFDNQLVSESELIAVSLDINWKSYTHFWLPSIVAITFLVKLLPSWMNLSTTSC